MTDHDRIREQLPHYVSGDLPPHEAEAIRRHLETNDTLRAEEAALRATLAILRRTDEDLAVPDAVAAFDGRALTSSLPTTKQGSPWRRWAIAAGLLVAFSAGAAAGRFLLPGGESRDDGREPDRRTTAQAVRPSETEIDRFLSRRPTASTLARGLALLGGRTKSRRR